jgi:hypothetical protein
MSDGLKEADKDRQNRTAVRTSKIQTELGTLKARLERLYVDKLEGEITSEFYKETKAKWESRAMERWASWFSGAGTINRRRVCPDFRSQKA